MSDKKDYTELVIRLSNADIQGFRQLTKADTEDDLSQCALELIQQAIGKRKLGDYVHVEAHEKTVATKDREIARLKKELFETAGIWEQLVRAFHPEGDLQSTGKSMPAYVLERVSSLINSEKNQIETISNYEDRLQTLQETTIQRSEHEERVDIVSKEKQELQTQLEVETESVKRLNVKITEQESEIKELKIQTARQETTIVCLRDRIELTRENEKMWKDLYTQEYEKPFWRKILDLLMGRPDLPHTATDETPPEEKDAETEETPPEVNTIVEKEDVHR